MCLCEYVFVYEYCMNVFVDVYVYNFICVLEHFPLFFIILNFRLKIR